MAKRRRKRRHSPRPAVDSALQQAVRRALPVHRRAGPSYLGRLHRRARRVRRRAPRSRFRRPAGADRRRRARASPDRPETRASQDLPGAGRRRSERRTTRCLASRRRVERRPDATGRGAPHRPADEPVAARSADSRAQGHPRCLARTRDRRRPQPPGPAHDRGGRIADPAPDSRRQRRLRPGRPAAWPVPDHRSASGEPVAA